MTTGWNRDLAQEKFDIILTPNSFSIIRTKDGMYL